MKITNRSNWTLTYLEPASRVMGVRANTGAPRGAVHMKLSIGSGRIRFGITLSAAAIAVAGSLAVVATPAYAADEAEGTNCVATVPATDVRCFETYEEAKAFVASVAETTPENKPSAAAQRAYGQAMQSSTQIFLPVWIFTGFDLENYNLLNPFAGTYTLIGLNGPCTLTTADVDYTKATLPARWVNDISSYFDAASCWTKLYEDPNFGGSTRGYTGDSATLGGFNNITSSIKFS
jgi:hypothetical protein